MEITDSQEDAALPLTIIPRASAYTLFDAAIPDALLREVGRLVLAAYPQAEDTCESLAAFEEIHDLRAHLRRAILETSLASLQGRFGGVTVVTPTNTTRNAYHREIVRNGIVMTISMVRAESSPLPDARFRETLARSGQMAAFDDEPEPSAEDPLWAAVIHGPSPLTYRAPGFLKVVFPLPDGSHSGGIDILARFPDLLGLTEFEEMVGAEIFTKPAVATIDSEPSPTLRPGVVRPERKKAE
jgi:hypothetical protein